MMTEEERRQARNEASRRSRLKKKAQQLSGDLSPDLGGERATVDLSPNLGGARAARQDLLDSVVYLTSCVQGWYGKSDSPYLPYEEFVKHHGVEALEEEVIVTITSHWDSGWPDYHETQKKYKVKPPKEWRQCSRDAWQLCTEKLEELYPEWRERRSLRRAMEAAYREATAVDKGKRVRVVKGRKVPVGLEGECVWLGQGDFGWRVGIKADNGETYWTALTNVDAIVDPDEFVY